MHSGNGRKRGSSHMASGEVSRAKETTLRRGPVLGQCLSAVTDRPRTSGKTQPRQQTQALQRGQRRSQHRTDWTTWCRDPVQYLPHKHLGYRSLHHVSNWPEGNFAIKKHQIHSLFSECVAGFISPLMSQLLSATSGVGATCRFGFVSLFSRHT